MFRLLVRQEQGLQEQQVRPEPVLQGQLVPERQELQVLPAERHQQALPQALPKELPQEPQVLPAVLRRGFRILRRQIPDRVVWIDP